ncbi:toxin-antitoxin system TumE family protein [Paraburkholderia tagetis]|uniref:DUF6516 family protein n=1 Tax=Paraburkholderia tagetis TaxID=2913261 RepID=A0A9X1UFP1_9BURK|nr:DUF6516 family protein [Paraburkholderia tagetis]
MHPYKYNLAYIVRGVCVLRYDNERGKGDHKHLGAAEMAYAFTTPEQLLEGGVIFPYDAIHVDFTLQAKAA